MLDASHPWICYWILHALYLLNAKLSDEMIDRLNRNIYLNRYDESLIYRIVV